jgi:hypothetical protein
MPTTRAHTITCPQVGTAQLLCPHHMNATLQVQPEKGTEVDWLDILSDILVNRLQAEL